MNHLETTGGFRNQLIVSVVRHSWGCGGEYSVVSVFCNSKYSNRHTSMHFIQVLLDITVHMHLYKEVGVEEEKSRMQKYRDGMGLRRWSTRQAITVNCNLFDRKCSNI